MPNMVALGTKDSGAGGFDDYGGKLELHRLDFLNRGLKCPIVGSVRIIIMLLLMFQYVHCRNQV
jgi:hypothetical protein